jgi:hypothetical protein
MGSSSNNLVPAVHDVFCFVFLSLGRFGFRRKVLKRAMTEIQENCLSHLKKGVWGPNYFF